MELVIPAAAALAGLLVGVLLGRLGRGGKARIAELEALVDRREGEVVQLEAARAETASRLQKAEQERNDLSEQLSDYRSDVVEHFSQTSELLKSMTLQYRNIYQHLAQGAESLCPEGTLHLEPNAPIEGLHTGEPAGEQAEAGKQPRAASSDDADDDGASVDSAHTDAPVQVDPRPEA
jgi:uncharacterized membrane-anchored protein YhcB (DUF1043 family)